MLKDRYGLAVSTQSAAARDAFVEGCDRLLCGNPDPLAAFEQAIAADPDFALAHAGRARAHQLGGEVALARTATARASALAAHVDAREASHIRFQDVLLSGDTETTLAAARAHLREWPRDAMVLCTCSSVFGLIGFSGHPGREAEQLALLEELAPAYGDDAWFTGVHAFALMETGQRDAARSKIEGSFRQNPRNANTVHVRTHMYYEDGEQAAARRFLEDFLASYPRHGIYHGHLSWHLCLCELQAGRGEDAFRIYADSLAPGVYQASALFVIADATSFLWRAALAGHEADATHWQVLRDFSHKMFPEPAIAYADTHIAIADAVMGCGAALEARVGKMEDMARAGGLASGPVAPALARGFSAFARQDYDGAIAAIEPVFAEHERLGGSRAQRDLIEFTLLKAYLCAGRLEDLQRALQARRPGPGGIPVEGLRALH